MPHLKYSAATGHLVRRDAAGDEHLVIECGLWCDVDAPITLDLSGVDAGRCTPCQGIDGNAPGWDVTAMAVDDTYSTYSIAHIGNTIIYTKTVTTVSVTLDDYFHFAGVCTATLLQTATCDTMTIRVELDCAVLDANDNPQIKQIDVRVSFNTAPCGSPWPDGFGGNATPPMSAFLYDRATHGGAYFPGDAVPNFNTCGVGNGGFPNPLSDGGTATIARA